MTRIETEVKNLKETNLCEHKDIKDASLRIESKLDEALKTKADKEEMKILDSKVWGIVLAIVVAFIGIIATAIRVFLGS